MLTGKKMYRMLCRSTSESEGLILEYVENIRNAKVFLISCFFGKTGGIDPPVRSAKRLCVSWEKAEDSLGRDSRGKRLGSGSGTSRATCRDEGGPWSYLTPRLLLCHPSLEASPWQC